MKNFYFISALLFSSLIYGQAFDIKGVNRDGKVYYKNGHTELGKLTFRQTVMSIRPENGKGERIDLDGIEKFEVFRKRDTVGYAYIISKRNYKRKKRYLNLIVYDRKRSGFIMSPLLPHVLVLLASVNSFILSRKRTTYTPQGS